MVPLWDAANRGHGARQGPTSPACLGNRCRRAPRGSRAEPPGRHSGIRMPGPTTRSCGRPKSKATGSDTLGSVQWSVTGDGARPRQVCLSGRDHAVTGSPSGGVGDRRMAGGPGRDRPTTAPRSSSTLCPDCARTGQPVPQLNSSGPHSTKETKTASNLFSQVRGRSRWWWRVKGSNLRRLSRQIYSLLPLTTRATRPSRAPRGAPER